LFIAGLYSFIAVPRPLPAAALVVRCRYLIVVPRPMSAAPLVVFRGHLLVVPRSLPRRRVAVLLVVTAVAIRGPAVRPAVAVVAAVAKALGSRRRTTLLMCSGKE
jgi:hypothetical protein